MSILRVAVVDQLVGYDAVDSKRRHAPQATFPEPPVFFQSLQYNDPKFALADLSSQRWLNDVGLSGVMGRQDRLGRRFVALVVLLFVTAILVGGWFGRSWSAKSAAIRHRIEGRSMAPSLWSAHAFVTCETCRFRWKVDADVAISASSICPYCGHSSDSFLVSQRFFPDVVQSRPVTALRSGQLLVIRKNGRQHVKRLVAVPGDQITLDGSRLLVNGERIEDRLDGFPCSVPLPRFVVDQDSKRRDTRWETHLDHSNWSRSSLRQWITKTNDTMTPYAEENPVRVDSRTDWLCYAHRSVHDHGQRSGVLDDYPGNLDLQRKLYPVDRLSLSGVADSSRPTKMVVGFWSNQGNRSIEIMIEGKTEFQLQFGTAKPDDGLPVTPQRPIAVRIIEGDITLSELQVDRLIEYRLRPSDDRARYPQVVPETSVFVLGDNVPVSVDSRDYGMVPIEAVVGVIDR